LLGDAGFYQSVGQRRCQTAFGRDSLQAPVARLSEHFTAVEQRSEPLIVGPQMLDPDRRINEDHVRLVRRRAIAARSGSVPPRRASRRAASRATNARSASRTKADLSRIPVYASALASSSRQETVSFASRPIHQQNSSSFDVVINAWQLSPAPHRPLMGEGLGAGGERRCNEGEKLGRRRVPLSALRLSAPSPPPQPAPIKGGGSAPERFATSVNAAAPDGNGRRRMIRTPRARRAGSVRLSGTIEGRTS
jgi:hypothetical protein